MSRRSIWRLAPLISAVLFAASLAGTPATATNGYFTNGYSPQSKGMAGASTAVDTGVTGLAVNPAMGAVVGNRAEG